MKNSQEILHSRATAARRNPPHVPGFASLLVALAALVIFVIPGAADSLALQRHGVIANPWQLFTGHLAHFGSEHLAWDALAFLVLGTLAERRSLRQWTLTLFGSAFLISLSILIFQPEIMSYRGLSGIDSALFGLVCINLLRDAIAARDIRCVSAIVLILAAFAGKIAYELITGHTFFVQDMGPGVGPVVLAHAIGFVSGALVVLITSGPRAANLRLRYNSTDVFATLRNFLRAAGKNPPPRRPRQLTVTPAK